MLAASRAWVPYTKAFHGHLFALPRPAPRRFLLATYARLHARVAREALELAIDLVVPAAAQDEDLLRAHAPDYVRRLGVGQPGREAVIYLARADLWRLGHLALSLARPVRPRPHGVRALRGA